MLQTSWKLERHSFSQRERNISPREVVILLQLWIHFYYCQYFNVLASYDMFWSTSYNIIFKFMEEYSATLLYFYKYNRSTHSLVHAEAIFVTLKRSLELLEQQEEFNIYHHWYHFLLDAQLSVFILILPFFAPPKPTLKNCRKNVNSRCLVDLCKGFVSQVSL